jgi:hypothetical protein
MAVMEVPEETMQVAAEDAKQPDMVEAQQDNAEYSELGGDDTAVVQVHHKTADAEARVGVDHLVPGCIPVLEEGVVVALVALVACCHSRLLAR